LLGWSSLACPWSFGLPMAWVRLPVLLVNHCTQTLSFSMSESIHICSYHSKDPFLKIFFFRHSHIHSVFFFFNQMWIGAPSIQSRTIFLPSLVENHLFMSVTFGPVPLHFGNWASPTLLRHQASQHHQCPPRNPLHRWLLICCPNQNFFKNHNTHL
jgi:hypothetical protein